MNPAAALRALDALPVPPAAAPIVADLRRILFARAAAGGRVPSPPRGEGGPQGRMRGQVQSSVSASPATGGTVMAFVDPKSLAGAERTALARLAGPGLFRRGRGGWFAAGSAAGVTLKTGKALIRLGLAREDFGVGRPALMLTYAGRAVAGVIAERNERNRA